MKYPENQFKLLIEALRLLLKGFELTPAQALENVGIIHNLHFRAFVNYTYPNNNSNVLNKDFKRLTVNGGERLLNVNEAFKLYPDGCNDSHIETAVKKALKLIQTNN